MKATTVLTNLKKLSSRSCQEHSCHNETSTASTRFRSGFLMSVDVVLLRGLNVKKALV